MRLRLVLERLDDRNRKKERGREGEREKEREKEMRGRGEERNWEEGRGRYFGFSYYRAEEIGRFEMK